MLTYTAPPGWKKQHGLAVQVYDAENLDPLSDTESVEASAYKKAWARLLLKVYKIDPFICPRCGSEMKVLAIILKPQEIKRILHHLVKQGRPPPGADLDAMNLFFLSHAPLMVSECILTSTFRPFMRIFSIFLEN